MNAVAQDAAVMTPVPGDAGAIAPVTGEGTPIARSRPFPGTALAQSRGWLAAISLGALALSWWLVTSTGLVTPLFLPSPADVLRQLIKAGTSGYMDATLAEHAWASTRRILAAAGVATIVGVPIGLLMGTHRVVKGLVDPLIEIYRPIPPLAYLPLIVIWAGIGEASKIIVIFLAILAPVIVSTAHGAARAGGDRVRAAQSLGASRAQLLWHVVLPGALPDILTGLRIGLGAGWSTLIAAELVAATQGLGFMVQSAAQFLATDMVIAGILVIAAFAVLIELALRWLQRRLSPWHGRGD